MHFKLHFFRVNNKTVHKQNSVPFYTLLIINEYSELMQYLIFIYFYFSIS